MDPLDLRRRFRDTFGGLSSTFWTLWLGILINRLGGFVVPFLGLYLTRARGFSIEDAGVIVALCGAGSVTASFVGGVLADHLGRRATLILSLATGSVAMLALGAARAPLVIAVLAYTLAFTSDLARPATSAMIADVVPSKDRLRAYGLQHWAINIGFSIAPVLAGLMADVSYAALFIADAASTLIYLGLVLVRLREPAGGGHAREPLLRGLAMVVRDRVFLAFVALSFVAAAIYKQIDVSLAVDMGAHGISPRGYGAVIAVNGVLIVLFSPTVARLLTGVRRDRVLAAAALLCGAGFAMHTPATTALGYVAGVVVWTFGEIISSPASAAMVAERAPPALRGRYQGLFQMSWGLAAFVGPTVGTRVVGRFGADTLWIGCGVVGALVAAGFLRLRLRA